MNEEVADILQNLDLETRGLFSETLLGEDASEFVRGDLGRAMVGIAKQEWMSALLELETVAWWRRRRIKELQNKAWRSRSFILWLRDLVVQGRQAAASLDEGARRQT